MQRFRGRIARALRAQHLTRQCTVSCGFSSITITPGGQTLRSAGDATVLCVLRFESPPPIMNSLCFGDIEPLSLLLWMALPATEHELVDHLGYF